MRRNLKEEQYAYHYSRGREHDLRPYVSDNRYRMYGRDTGHFGSGTYFATYDGANGFTDDVSTPEFVKIKDGLYRVDMDLYKNLYRVETNYEGQLLFKLCRNLNRLFNRITDSYGGKLSPNANYGNADLYQEIKANADALGLNCPSYLKLTRMAQEHARSDNRQSFSTVFMEYNGFNGVNVCGIPEYDNTTHGSVIYDLSKVSGNIKKLKKNIPFSSRFYRSDVAYDKMVDPVMTALQGDDIFWSSKIVNGEYDLKTSLRLLKNYTESGNLLDSYVMKRLDDRLLKRYLSIVFYKGRLQRTQWGKAPIDELINRRDFYDLIKKAGAWYYLRYTKTIEVMRGLFYGFDWDATPEEVEEFGRFVLANLGRVPTDEEKQYVEEWIEETK